MNNTIVLYALLAFAGVYIAVDKIGRPLKAWFWELWVEALKKAAHKEDLSAHEDEALKLLAGTVKACEAIAKATCELREEVAELRGLLTNGKQAEQAPAPLSYPEGNFIPPASDAEVEKTITYVDAIQRGLSHEQAQQEAEEAAEKKTMLSAVSFGLVDE